MAFHILVLAGGSGTRLWPLSRAAVPKHLLPLGPGDMPLLRTTVDRVGPLTTQIHVVTAAAQATACLAVLDGQAGGSVSIIAEPVARGTGPALGLAVHEIVRTDPEAVMVVVHADHYVADDDAYRAAVLASAGWAVATEGLATVGLTPTFPATGLGYIALGQHMPPQRWRPPPQSDADAVLLAAAAALPAARSAGFVEKPDRDRAEEFVRGGGHLWNLGLFAWSAPVFLDELGGADPELDRALGHVVDAREAGDEARASQLYSGLAVQPVEPLIFERTRRLTVVQAGFGWSDLGTWSDLAGSRAGSADPDGNVGGDAAVIMSSRDCFVVARGGRTVTVLGAQGLVVVDTGDAVLVMDMSAAQEVKALVERLRAEGLDEVL